MTTRNRTVRGPRRRVVWADSLFDESISNGGQDLKSLHSLLLTENFDLTVTRIILGLTFSPATLLVVQSQMQLDMGIGIASQEAFAAGTVPDPDVASEVPSSGWLWRHRLIVNDATSSPGLMPTSVVVDIASQRKLQRGELYLVVNNNGRTGTAFNVNMNGLIRVLFKR